MSEYPDLTDARLWSIQQPYGDDRMLLDPTTRRILNPNEMPQCIGEDTLLSTGVRSLIERRSVIRMKTAYTRHVAEDDLSFGWRGREFERSVRRADYFGFEARGYDAEGPEYYNRVKDLRRKKEVSRTQPIMNRGVDVTGYVNRRARAIATCGSAAKCFPMDVARINCSPLEGRILEAQNAFLDTPHWDFETYAALCGIRNVRQWIMLARLGIALQEREGDRKRKLHIFNLFGRQHQDVTRKARLLGIACESIVKDQNDDLLEETRMMEVGVVPYQYYAKFNQTTDHVEGN